MNTTITSTKHRQISHRFLLFLRHPIHETKREYLKFFISTIKRMNSDDYVTRSEDEFVAKTICRKVIRSAETKLLTCPKTDRRYAKNDTLSINIILSNGKVEIIMKNFRQVIFLSKKTHDTIKIMFDGHIEMQRNDLEKSIKLNIKTTLSTILDEINEYRLNEI